MSTHRICPKCDGVVAAEEVFCVNCATGSPAGNPQWGGHSQTTLNAVGQQGGSAALAASSASPVSASAGGQSGSGKWPWIFLALIAVGVAVYFATRGGDAAPSIVEEPVPAVEFSAPAGTPSASTPAATASKPKPAANPAASTPPPAPRPDANYDAGMAAYRAGDGLEAIKCFTASGSAQSTYMLGVVYETGCGSVAANAMKARSYYKKAASMGSVEAKAKL